MLPHCAQIWRFLLSAALLVPAALGQDTGAAVSDLERELPALRRALRHEEILDRLGKLPSVELPAELKSRIAQLLGIVAPEAELLKKLGPLSDRRGETAGGVVHRLAALKLDPAEEMTLAGLAFLGGERATGEDALARAVEKDAGRKESADKLLAASRGESVPRGGYFRYRRQWVPMETRDRAQAFDEAYEKLYAVHPDGIGWPFVPAMDDSNLERFATAIGERGEAFFRDGAARLRKDLQGDYDDVRKWLPGYSRQPSIRKNLLALREEMAKPRREALALIGRYQKPEQPQVDAFRKQLEGLQAKGESLWDIERRALAGVGADRADEVLARIRAREGALEAIDRWLLRSTGGGLGPAEIKPAAGSEVTARHLLPGRTQSGLEDVLWLLAHHVAGRPVEVIARADELLHWAPDLTPWEALVTEEFRAEAVEAYNDLAALSLDSEERRFAKVLNRYRRVLGLRPFEVEERLNASARKHSREMVALGYFGHISPVARNRGPTDRARNEGYGGGVGENCLGGAADGQGAFEGWYHSPGHHRNLVSGGPQLGVGATSDHGMWTMVAGGADFAWRSMHRDRTPAERRRLDAAAQKLADDAKAGAITAATRDDALSLLPAILAPIGRLGLAAANDHRSPIHAAWVPLLAFVIEADVSTEWRPLQVAAVAAVISGLEIDLRPEVRSRALGLVAPLCGDLAGFDPNAGVRPRQKAVAEIFRTWEDVAQFRYRQGAVRGLPPRPLLPGRVGDGPTLEAALRVLTKKDRLQFAKDGGGGSHTEAAVEKGLVWLARAQDPDGGWHARSFATVDPAFRGLEARLGLGNAEWEVAMTGLSLLAFASAGNTTVQGPHAKTVARGVQFLLERVVDYGRFETASSHYMYGHAMATQALCELYAYSGDPRLGVHAQLAVDFLMYAQHQPGGGWRYEANEAGDTSVTGWVVMALNAALKAKLDVSGFRGALRFLDSVTAPGYYRIGYTTAADGGQNRLGAVGMLTRLFLEGNPKDPRILENAWRLKSDLPARGKEDFYCWYYATLALFQVGGEMWKAWNDALVPVLLASQVNDATPLDGSWNPDGHYGNTGGRIYQTALGVLMLTTYYRYDRALRPKVASVTGRIEDLAKPYLDVVRAGADPVVTAVTGRKLVDRFGAAAAPVLMRLVRDQGETPDARRRFAALLPECAAPEHEVGLLDLLGEASDDALREMVILALEGVCSAQSVDLLAKHLGHGSYRVRGYAAQALGRIGDPAAAPLIADRLKVEPDDWCKAVMTQALGRLAHREGISAVIDDAMAKEAAGRLRVLRGLDLLESGGLGQRLLATKTKEPKLYERALAAIRDHEEAAAIPILLVLLESSDQDTRSEANKLLMGLTRVDHGFDAAKPEAQRRDALGRWQTWWREHLAEYGAAKGR